MLLSQTAVNVVLFLIGFPALVRPQRLGLFPSRLRPPKLNIVLFDCDPALRDHNVV